MRLRRLLIPVIFLAVLALFIFCPTDVLARAGGGGGFSGGGGGGSGGGSGGGDGLGFLIFLLFRLCVDMPIVGIPLVILVIAGFYFSAKNGRHAQMQHTIKRAVRHQPDQMRRNMLAKLMNRDPAFEEQAFVKRCVDVFPKVQKAWSGQDMRPVELFLSDGVRERFRLQLRMQCDCDLVNRMENVLVKRADVVAAESDTVFDTLHVLINAEAIDKTDSISKGRTVQGQGQVEDFTEVWSFIRAVGAGTRVGPGLMEGYCPNCGAPLSISDSAECSSCNAKICSGEYDWVLAEITQIGAWSASEARTIPGLDKIREEDPAFNAQLVEDRASAIFWRLRAAEFYAEKQQLGPSALPDYLTAQSSLFESLDSGEHRFYADASLGAVDLLDVRPGDEEGFDSAYVRMTWSGHLETCKVPSLIVPNYGKSYFIDQVFELKRKSGVKTPGGTGLSSLHCPGCGAPEEVTVTDKCRYCGLAQNDGSAGWVLSAVSSYAEFASQQAPILQSKTNYSTTPVQPLFSSLPSVSPQQYERMMQCVIAVMLADGMIDEREQNRLETMAQRHQIAVERLQQLIEQVKTNEAELPVPEPALRNRFLDELVTMALMDGRICSAERHVIEDLAQRMGFVDWDVNNAIGKKRRELYNQAKTVLKG